MYEKGWLVDLELSENFVALEKSQQIQKVEKIWEFWLLE